MAFFMINAVPKYRVLWNWDYDTFWDDSFFWRGKGAGGVVNQRRAHFLEDYKRMVDFSASHGINAIVIWGALRAHDKGEEQLKELATYATKKGIRILVGCGVFGYGGIYYDPRKDFKGFYDTPVTPHPYSLYTWLKKHPKYIAIGPDGKPYAKSPYSIVACPSRKENIEWFKEALEWLLTEFDIGGIQVEVGDYGVCHCDECKKRRSISDIGTFSIEDMLYPYRVAIETAKKIKPDAWVICETYSSFAVPTLPEAPGFASALDDKQKDLLASLPEGAIVQWVSDRAVGLNPTHIWAPDVYVPTRDNIARIHAGSQWTGNSTEEWGIHTIGDLVKKARMSGLNGVSIFGEESPASPPNEANYLVFSEFNGFGNPNPNCNLELFYSQTLDPLYGGRGMAKEWERIYVTGHIIRLNKQLLSPNAKEPLYFHPVHLAINQPDLVDRACKMTSTERQQLTIKLANEAHDISSKLSGETCRRWSWLENWLWRAEFLHRTSISD